MRFLLLAAILVGFAITPTSPRSDVTYTGIVFTDYDSNGQRDPNEPGVAGAVVTLYTTDLTRLSEHTTGANGLYSLSTEYSYSGHILVETDPLGYKSTTVNEVWTRDQSTGATYTQIHFGDVPASPELLPCKMFIPVAQ